MMPSKNGILTFQFFWGCFSWFSCRLEKVCQFFPSNAMDLVLSPLRCYCCRPQVTQRWRSIASLLSRKILFSFRLTSYPTAILAKLNSENLVQNLRTEQLFSTVFLNLNMIFSIYFSTAWCHSFNWLPKPSYTKYVAFGSNKMIELER